MKQATKFISLLLALTMLCSCGAPSADAAPKATTPTVQETASPAEEPADVSPSSPYEAPPFAECIFDADAAQGNDLAQIDTSNTSKGYIAASGHSDQRLKIQVIAQDTDPYNYDLPSDGTPAFYPIQSGDGLYTFRVLENISGTKYAVQYSVDVEVTLEDEFQPFLRPSQFVDYAKEDECVRIAGELAKKSATDLDVVHEVFDYICANVVYDKEKAANIPSTYLPDLDNILSSGKGICFDYAALAAAMLRSQGIPTKMIFGYVSPHGLYHAWNMFYTEESGWVTVDYEVSSETWDRLDLTFSANGADGTFIGDGGNYTDIYLY